MNTPASTKVEQRDLAMMQEFYLSDWYDPKARNNAAVVAGAIAFAHATLIAASSGEGREAIARIIAPRSFDNEGSTSWHSREVGRRGAYTKADAILALLAPHKDTSHD